MDCNNKDCRECGRATSQGGRYDNAKGCYIRTFNCLIGRHDREYLEYDDGREKVIEHY
jgi:hypothetical protein